MNLRINANAVITNKDGKILLIRLNNGPWKGGLCIPGGGIEPGEMSFETIKREIKEETGIDLKNPIHPFGFCELIKDEIKSHKIVLLLQTTAEGVPVQNDEHSPLWMNYEEAEKNLIPFAREALRIWKEKKVHFVIKE